MGNLKSLSFIRHLWRLHRLVQCGMKNIWTLPADSVSLE